MTLSQYTRLSLQGIKRAGGTVFVSHPETVSGQPGFYLEYSLPIGPKGGLRAAELWRFGHGKAWLITYTADPEHFSDQLSMVRRLMASVVLPA